MWKDICLANSDHLVTMIDRYIFSLNKFKREIMAGDKPVWKSTCALRAISEEAGLVSISEYDRRAD
jgi:prephenate dehydrogenase